MRSPMTLPKNVIDQKEINRFLHILKFLKTYKDGERYAYQLFYDLIAVADKMNDEQRKKFSSLAAMPYLTVNKNRRFIRTARTISYIFEIRKSGVEEKDIRKKTIAWLEIDEGLNEDAAVKQWNTAKKIIKSITSSR